MLAPTIKIEDLSLHLPVPRLHRHTVSKGDTVGGRFITTPKGRTFVKSLDNLNVEIYAGDCVGLIGSNGAGKSTLLRVMAGIYRTYKGRCAVRGGVSTLFTNNVGLNVNGTGMENMRLMGRLLGMTNIEIEEAMPGIVEFCELGDYLHLPMRTYSAGMRTRIGFAIATAANPDVLLIDEVFGTGDAAFRKKAGQRIDAIIENANVVVMATHSNQMLKSFCNKLLWLEHGRVKAFGPMEEVMVEYAG